MIQITEVCKKYRKKIAVDQVSFTAPAGCITGLIGPNGAGKSTTLRILLGLTNPTSGSATINGKSYRELGVFPLLTVGALLDNTVGVPERRAVDHLRWIAQSNRISKSRVAEVLDQVGLGNAGRTRVRKYSLGMRQRLGIAATILGKPQVIILDEPMNGLDPEGIRWVRDFMVERASQGATVLVASHFMKELEDVAERVVILSKGCVQAEGKLQDVTDNYSSLEEAYFHYTSDVVK